MPSPAPDPVAPPAAAPDPAPPAAPAAVPNAPLAPAPIALVALTVFQNSRVNGGEAVTTGQRFDAPDLDYARDAVRLRLAEPADPAQLAAAEPVRAPDGALVGIADIARPVAPLPDSALPEDKRAGARAGKAAGLLALLLALLLPFAPARAQNANTALFGDFSTPLTTTPVQVIPAAANRTFLRLVHPGRPGDPTAWCSDTTATPAPYAAGSIPIGPYGNPSGYSSVLEMSIPGYVSKKAWFCRAETGTPNLTAEAH